MREYLLDIIKCVRCGRCRTVCPAQKVLGWESSGARGRMQMALGLTSGLEATDGMMEGLLTCTTCQKCVLECPAGADPPEVIQAARGKLAALGRISLHQIEMQERIKRTGNSLGDEYSGISWLTEPITGKSEYVYFAGCLASYRHMATAEATYDILKRFGVGLLGDERCCGSPLLRLGLDASKLIEHNTREIKKIGAKTVIAGCAGCYSMFKERYTDFDVLHLSEFLVDKLHLLPLGGLDKTVTYHDPCHLGRSYGIYDAPREVIKHICTLEEMISNREKANCCGGGGGVRLGYPELSGSIADNLVKNIPESADYVVTACPLCFRNLSDAGIKVLDLADLIWISLGDQS